MDLLLNEEQGIKLGFRDLSLPGQSGIPAGLQLSASATARLYASPAVAR